MILALRLLTALGLAGLLVFSSLRLERRLEDGGHAAPGHGSQVHLSPDPGIEQPAEPADGEGPGTLGDWSFAAIEEGRGAGLELRAFVPGGAEHRAELRIELFGPSGARHGVAFAAPPYRVLGLQPGDWRVAVAGPVLEGRAGAARLEIAQIERLRLTHASPSLDELAWPPPAARQEFSAGLEHLQPTVNQTPAPSPLPAAAVPASR